MEVSPGVWVRQAIAAGSRAFGKYANVALEKCMFNQIMDEWSTDTGKDGVFVQCSSEAYEARWGTPGKELAEQFKIKEAEVIGFKGTIEGLHTMGAWG
ncbi:hypothetical protein MCOR29_010702 [Pyricularia oryzae]|nr:hypothetical protein MCOR19_011068 [Pyricularia oryzae]KAI6303827.1 hypothetical protein MCOR29_010702 [Pyricularia oryzae]KAI6333333.1 hypothetical protein MCOR28_010533 [Pyricularia oryzae]KAI6388073.1 hypothetical protein MCOR24_010844 [Pyricularia oryzae]KAI6468188.1 hypothetical protein MCOR17_004188 [Pyricularia oryzae]